MKSGTIVRICAAVVVMALISGCATALPAGAGYLKLKLPVCATANPSNSPKVGTAQCVSYCGVVAIGDVSIHTAMKNGGITKIHHVDWEVESIAGIIGKYKIIVYGE